MLTVRSKSSPSSLKDLTVGYAPQRMIAALAQAMGPDKEMREEGMEDSELVQFQKWSF